MSLFVGFDIGDTKCAMSTGRERAGNAKGRRPLETCKEMIPLDPAQGIKCPPARAFWGQNATINW